jgi:glycosyltransferase involved in cell wall biosynthesis
MVHGLDAGADLSRPRADTLSGHVIATSLVQHPSTNKRAVSRSTHAAVLAPPAGGSAHKGQRRRIALIGPARYPIAQPFAGGLQSHVWTLCHALRARGHEVTLFAAPGSDPDLRPVDLQLSTSWLSLDARRDVSMQPDLVVGEHHAYLSLMLQLGRDGSFDVVHNHSLHYLPIAMSDVLRTPVLTTLHTPPTPWLESAVRAARPASSHFIAVSRHTAAAWRGVAGDLRVVANGIDTERWPFGPGGGPLVWSGRIAPEKGVHLAIAAAREARRPLDIAGPIVDRAYFDAWVLPQLDSRTRYLGHLDQTALSNLVRHAELALVTPNWDEPYGLVVAEALSSGTPVVGFERGGIPEVVDETCARLVPPGDVAALARAIGEARGLGRQHARLRAERRCSVEAMIDRYEQVLGDVIAEPAA